jgi:hypothetical protein
MTEAAAQERAADFVRRFAEFWAAPAPELLAMVLADEVRLAAPLTPVTHTLAEGERAFAGLFELIPDLTAEVHSWGATESGVLIDFTLRGHAGGAPISWRAVDRFEIGGDGLATERVSYFDPLPLILAIVRRPRVWRSFAAARRRGR